MKVYTEIILEESPDVPGLFLPIAETRPTPANSHESLSSLVADCEAMSGKFMMLASALIDPDFVRYGVQDIRGGVYNAHDIYATLECGEIFYSQILESEVSPTFYL